MSTVQCDHTSEFYQNICFTTLALLGGFLDLKLLQTTTFKIHINATYDLSTLPAVIVVSHVGRAINVARSMRLHQRMLAATIELVANSKYVETTNEVYKSIVADIPSVRSFENFQHRRSWVDELICGISLTANVKMFTAFAPTDSTKKNMFWMCETWYAPRFFNKLTLLQTPHL